MGRIEDMVLLDDVEVSSYTVGEDSRALVVAKVSIKMGHNSHRDTNEEGMLATGSMGYDTSQGDGRTGLVGEADRTNDVPSMVTVDDNIDLVELASNSLAWRDEFYDLCHSDNFVALNKAVFH